MKLYAALLAALSLMLAACGSEAPAPAPDTRAQAEMPPEVPVMGEERLVLALGDSLFTGYRLEEGESYPDMLEAALRARGINVRMVNAGVSGDTTAAARGRLTFALDAQPRAPDLVLISLGGNDMLRALPVEQARENLEAIMAELDERGIDMVLLGMLAAPNLGEGYAQDFNAIYPSLAKKYDATLVPFFLQPLIANPSLAQADRIHPTREGIEAMVSDTVDEIAGALQP